MPRPGGARASAQPHHRRSRDRSPATSARRPPMGDRQACRVCGSCVSFAGSIDCHDRRSIGFAGAIPIHGRERCFDRLLDDSFVVALPCMGKLSRRVRGDRGDTGRSRLRGGRRVAIIAAICRRFVIRKLVLLGYLHTQSSATYRWQAYGGVFVVCPLRR